MAVEVILIYGQGGKSPLSAGFILFKNRLVSLGYNVADHFSWDRPDAVIKYIHDRRSKEQGLKIAGIGYSMGALAWSWIASAGQRIELIAAYDPSAGFGPIFAAPPNPIGANVKRCLCYVHTFPELFRIAPFTGNCEIIHTWAPHGLVQVNERLHQITLRALYDVEVT